MSDDYRRIEDISRFVRLRHWSTRGKPQMIEASALPGERVSSVAQRHGVAAIYSIVGDD